ncbi:MAG: hypothetical protein ACFBWO_08955, partial [Paracoccaceae bacterium]
MNKHDEDSVNNALRKLEGITQEVERAVKPLSDLMKTKRQRVGSLDFELSETFWSATFDCEVMFPCDQLEELRKMLERRGLLHLYGNPHLNIQQYYEVIMDACNANEASPRTDRIEDAEAWVLSEAIFLHWCAVDKNSDGDNDDSINPDFELNCLISLGRLLEWWRWRREGLDRMAAFQRKAQEQLNTDPDGNRRAHNERQRTAAEARTRAAREIAARK